VNRVFLEISIDWRVVGFTTSVAVVTALLFGTLPSLHATRVAPIDALKKSGRGLTGGPHVVWPGRLVVVQVALSLVLLAASGLFLRSFVRLATAPIGFDADRVLLVNVNTSRTHIEAADRLPLFLRLMQTAFTFEPVAISTIGTRTTLHRLRS
jgi:putative ABC transport system permease protein